jgi:phosphoribosylglycinamide formyltransferase-1
MERVKSPFAIFCSGRGSNALALIEQAQRLGCKPELIVVNRNDAGILKELVGKNLNVHILDAPRGAIERSFEDEALKYCHEYNIRWVFLAGFMKILSEHFLKSFKADDYYRVLNIHPSLLPDFPGLGGYEQAYVASKEMFGFTIHLVDEQVDHGRILAQGILSRVKGDSLESFQSRGLKLENKCYPIVLTGVLENEDHYINECLKDKVVFVET